MLSPQRLFVLFIGSALAPFCLHAETAAELYERIAHTPVAGECVEVDIEPLPEASTILVSEEDSKLIYPMTHNNVAEGWSWHPGADPAVEDYYRFKFLPLGSVQEERGEYAAEDQIGKIQRMKVRWRYDYFLAFDNIYDFQYRDPAGEVEFVAGIKLPPGHAPALRAEACLQPSATTESTTFWKATHGQPVDFTLKKRYLIGKLKRLTLVDTSNGAILATINPLSSVQP